MVERSCAPCNSSHLYSVRVLKGETRCERDKLRWDKKGRQTLKHRKLCLKGPQPSEMAKQMSSFAKGNKGKQKALWTMDVN